ncbi:Lrp/AsnC family transcriptional regulator [Bradyrhizobium septentrionale]|uniref:Lrp/AsnC family transcriptional regulator n=1 Tax=Bradyrhizobium septentrionale TaxID=1404411 RepID=A0A973ZYK7_9BRAD|nr:Lrp/AsnC family transcriptional regulator [Bradyrhizobium septentrionale]UGY19428.1 Lrp/AsnC family transcriptional regulator [Bradyrhizobium septentrionale]UGY28197.1 Lrp/AsnC family transcriptional regulator [Bradyrhizobium septentrionale]
MGTTIVLDEIDRKILDVLQVEGRITNLELAEQIGLSSAPCMRRVRTLEEAGVIRSYVALVDPAKIGLGFDVIVEVRLKQQTRESFERFEKKVTGLPEVVECCMIAGDWDYSLRVVSSDLARYQSFILDRLMQRDTDIASYRTTIILRKVKSTTKIDPSLF